MNIKKIIISILIIILLSILSFYGYFYYISKGALNKVRRNQNNINTMILENSPDSIEIDNKSVNKSIIDSLKLNRWKPKLIWKIKLAPTVYIQLNDISIQLYEGDPYAKIEIENSKKSHYYYVIPIDICTKIIQYIDNNRAK